MTELAEKHEREKVRKRARRRGFELHTNKDHPRYALRHSELGNCGTYRDLAEVTAELNARQDMQAA